MGLIAKKISVAIFGFLEKLGCYSTRERKNGGGLLATLRSRVLRA
jgi:hypothetical protein